MRATEGAAGLDSQLESYAAAVKSDGGSARLTRWSIYAAATGSALAMATSADAGIIAGVANVSIQAPRLANATTRRITDAASFGSLGRLRIGAFFGNHASHTSASVGFLGSGGASVLATYYGNIRRFNSGSIISAGLGRWSFGGTVAGFSNCGCGFRGEFTSPNHVTGVAAFRLAGNHLGWIRLAWSSSLGDSYPDTLTALDWAYNDVANAPIVAGVIPEPGTAAMSILAAGAMGILAWRKRRRAVAEAAPVQE